MPGYGQFKIKKVWKMLDTCLDGYTKTEGAHKWIVRHGETECLDLPLGEHGNRSSGNTLIEKGQLRALVRTFKIEDCAKRFFAL